MTRRIAPLALIALTMIPTGAQAQTDPQASVVMRRPLPNNARGNPITQTSCPGQSVCLPLSPGDPPATGPNSAYGVWITCQPPELYQCEIVTDNGNGDFSYEPTDIANCSKTQSEEKNAIVRAEGIDAIPGVFLNLSAQCGTTDTDGNPPTPDYTFWEVGDWTTTPGGSVVCGSPASLIRDVKCKGRVYSSGATLDYQDAVCTGQAGPKPEASYTGNDAGCGYHWTQGDFGPWSTTCGYATRTSAYVCVDTADNVVPDAKCINKYGIGTRGEPKPAPGLDSGYQYSGCRTKLYPGNPVIGECVVGNQTVSFPDAFCNFVDEQGNDISRTNLSDCGGPPPDTTQTCGDRQPLDPSDPKYQSCLRDPLYDRYFTGPDGGANNGASRAYYAQFLSTGGHNSPTQTAALDPGTRDQYVRETCDVGRAKGYTCCISRTRSSIDPDGDPGADLEVIAFPPGPAQFGSCEDGNARYIEGDRNSPSGSFYYGLGYRYSPVQCIIWGTP